MRRLLWLLPVLGLLGACSDKNADDVFKPASLVEDLRILAVRADPPEAAPGQFIALSALVANPHKDAPSPGYLWVLCDPTTEGALGNACAQQETLRDFDPRSLPDGVRIFPLFFNFALYRAPPESLAPLPPESLERKRGLTATVLLVAWEGGNLNDLEDSDTRRQMAIKRIRIVDPQRLANTNPEIRSLTLDGAPFPDDGLPFPVQAGSTVELVASSPPSSTQEFERPMPDGTFETQSEQNVFSWYATGGQFTQGLSYSSRTESGDPIGLKLPPLGVLPDDQLDLWVVLRDARGGTDWASRRLQLVP